MTTQTAPQTAADIPVGVRVTTNDGLTGTMTVRRTPLGDRILCADNGTWIPVTPNTQVTTDPHSYAADGSVAWGEQDGCPLGTAEMGCDMIPCCIGECGGIPEADAEVEIDDPDLDGNPLGTPIYAGPLAGAARVLVPGLYPGINLHNYLPVFVVITERGAFLHDRG